MPHAASACAPPVLIGIRRGGPCFSVVCGRGAGAAVVVRASTARPARPPPPDEEALGAKVAAAVTASDKVLTFAIVAACTQGIFVTPQDCVSYKRRTRTILRLDFMMCQTQLAKFHCPKFTHLLLRLIEVLSNSASLEVEFLPPLLLFGRLFWPERSRPSFARIFSQVSVSRSHWAFCGGPPPRARKPCSRRSTCRRAPRRVLHARLARLRRLPRALRRFRGNPMAHGSAREARAGPETVNARLHPRKRCPTCARAPRAGGCRRPRSLNAA
jgi:hypothetical protein